MILINRNIENLENNLIYYLQISLNDQKFQIIATSKSFKERVNAILNKNFKDKTGKLQIILDSKILKNLGQSFSK